MPPVERTIICGWCGKKKKLVGRINDVRDRVYCCTRCAKLASVAPASMTMADLARVDAVALAARAQRRQEQQ